MRCRSTSNSVAQLVAFLGTPQIAGLAFLCWQGGPTRALARVLGPLRADTTAISLMNLQLPKATESAPTVVGVLGGRGLLGSAIVRQLASRGTRVISIDRAPSVAASRSGSRVVDIQADVLDVNWWPAIQGVSVDRKRRRHWASPRIPGAPSSGSHGELRDRFGGARGRALDGDQTDLLRQYAAGVRHTGVATCR